MSTRSGYSFSRSRSAPRGAMGRLASSRSVAAMSVAARPRDADALGRQVGSSDAVPLPRNTQSAVTAARHTRGLAAILARWPIMKQHAIRQVCVERLDLLGRIDAVKSRIADAVGQGLAAEWDEKPDMLVALEHRLQENHETLTRTVGSAEGARVIEDALEGEEYRTKFGLPVASEAAARDGGAADESLAAGGLVEDEDDTRARVWRRRLDTRKASRRELGSRSRPAHSTTTKRGDRAVWDNITMEQAEADSSHLSYYQRQTRKYGRQRRGSTAVAGAWEIVFASGVPPDSAASQAGGASVAGGGGGAGRGYFSASQSVADAPDVESFSGYRAEEASAAAAARVAELAERMQRPSLAPGAGAAQAGAPPAPSSPPKGRAVHGAAAHGAAARAPGAQGAARAPSDGGQPAPRSPDRSGEFESPSARAARAAREASDRAGQDGGEGTAIARAIAALEAAEQASPQGIRPPRAPRTSGGAAPGALPAAAVRPPPASSSASTSASALHQPASGPGSSTGSLEHTGVKLARRGSSRRSARGGAASQATSGRMDGDSVSGFTTGDLDAVMPVMRRTASAASVAAQTAENPAAAVLADLPLRAHRAARLLCSEMAELVARYETAYDRHVEALGREPEDGEALPDVLLGIDAAVADTRDALVRAVGQDRAQTLVEMVGDPDARIAMGLAEESEDFQETEEDARLWRRKLGRFKSRTFQAGVGAAAEEAAAATTGRAPPSGREPFGAASADPRQSAENVSYYRRQARKYGRGRRGSTAHEGAWDAIFADAAQEPAGMFSPLRK
ncbi:hypothetical protein FNF29_06340 [Cafeteria roenbergensis]|uniref:Uncharacterized protein n=1 Tax=Cafeteria roenbergensis TaxID=33653 RepID=A0A5A8C705_CAFRO|nr:hypothetical protein FNF29_06340 [Cafeteria roenbergensis]|eukprot:KAA0148866.1 hypothetical protein FNF29_06340 [Cafeteria roenbergensis]